MRLTLLFSIVFFTLISCQKEEADDVGTASLCDIEMKELLYDKLSCSQQGFMETNLYTGLYQNKLVYFDMVVCPTCNTLPPAFGYTCDGEKITFVDFQKNVSNITQVYNACTLKFK